MIKTIITALLFVLSSSLHTYAESKPKNVEKYRKSLVLKCESEDPKACVKVGLHYLSGDLLPKDKEKALFLFQHACKEGVGDGCTFYGYSAYEDTRRDNREYAKAREFYTKGCDLGHGWGCSWLGMHFEMAWEIGQDFEVARLKYEQGCTLGDKTGCTSVGRMHERGIGAPVNAQLAREFYGKACKLGNKRVCAKSE